MTIDITKTCGRCDGSGEYSFNQIDGRRCYGCGGLGRVIDTKAAKKAGVSVAATAELRDAKPGDVIVSSKIPYRVEAVLWKRSGWYKGRDYTQSMSFGDDRIWGNQMVRAVCLVNGKHYTFYRMAFGEDRMSIKVSAEQEGQEVTYEPAA